ncbi:MAG: hypothetical protein ACI4JB_07430 [Porcipelethomonas sp.]
MRTDEIELSAAKNRPLPKYLTMPEMCLYLSLRALYSSWRRGDITKEQGTAEKTKAVAECGKFDSAYRQWCEVYRTYQDNIRKAETLLSEIEKSDDTADIAVKACETVGIMIGDANFAKRQKRKIFKEEV